MRLILILILIIFHSFTSFASAEEEEVYLLIDKSSNQLIVILNDQPIFHFPIATGKDIHLTPIGSFRITRKVKNPWYIPKNIPGGDSRNPVGTRWLGLNVPHTDGYKYGIHGTNDPSSIGKHVSQGCIRMKNEDIEWLYQHIPLSTRVVIQP